jgi:hypothetical protein
MCALRFGQAARNDRLGSTRTADENALLTRKFSVEFRGGRVQIADMGQRNYV